MPVINVNNNCSTGSSALFLARQAVKGGLVDCALALGFEKMENGSLGVKYTDRTNPMDKARRARCSSCATWEDAPPAPQMFGDAGREHMERYGSKPEHYAWIGWKNHKHSVNNPYAQFQDEYTLRGHQGRARDPRAADEAAVLADLRRRRRGDRRVASASSRARPVGSRRRDRRPGDGHRPDRARSTRSRRSRSSAPT